MISQDTGKHYRKEYKGIKLDPARIGRIYNIDHGCQFAILKKTLMAGKRGHKSVESDVRDIITAAERWLEMIAEDSQNESA